MATTLTPEQQALLEQFQQNAQKAHDANDAQGKADAQLATAMSADDAAWQANASAHTAALDAAQAFIDSLHQEGGTAAPKPAGAAAQRK